MNFHSLGVTINTIIHLIECFPNFDLRRDPKNPDDIASIVDPKFIYATVGDDKSYNFANVLHSVSNAVQIESCAWVGVR